MATTEEQAVVSSSPPSDSHHDAEAESLFTSVLCDLSQQVQTAMEDMLKTINEIDVHSGDVTEEVEKCKQSALERRNAIEQERECFQKAAYAVLDVLNIGGGKPDDQLYLENGNGY